MTSIMIHAIHKDIEEKKRPRLANVRLIKTLAVKEATIQGGKAKREREISFPYIITSAFIILGHFWVRRTADHGLKHALDGCSQTASSKIYLPGRIRAATASCCPTHPDDQCACPLGQTCSQSLCGRSERRSHRVRGCPFQKTFLPNGSGKLPLRWRGS